MRRYAAAVALLLSVGVGACGGSSAPEPAGNGDAALRDALAAYVVEFLRRNPATSTYLGGAALDRTLDAADGTLRDHSRAAIEAEDRWLSIAARGLSGLAEGTLTDAARADRNLALAQIRFLLRQHQVRRHQERALDTYVTEPLDAIDSQLQGLSETGSGTFGSSREWSLVISRVRAIPAFLVAAQTQLQAGISSGNVPDPRVLERDGLETTVATARYFADTLPRLAAERAAADSRDRIVAELRAAGADASAAYLGFRNHIASVFFEPGTRRVKAEFAADRFAMGEAEYDWALRNNFRFDRSAATLFDEAGPILEEKRRRMAELAAQIGARRGWPLPDGPAGVRAVIDRLSSEHPRSDAELRTWYREAAVALVEYARKTGLFDVPADYRVDVEETPRPMQVATGAAAYYPTPPFTSGRVGRFHVTPTHDDPAALRRSHRAAVAALAAHETFPGHHWHDTVLIDARTALAPVRWLMADAVESSSTMWAGSLAREGWGLYAETLMADPQAGAPNGFYSPEERLFQLHRELRRDLLVMIDTGLHIGRLGYEQATTLHSEVVDFLPGGCDPAGRQSSDAKRASCEAAERAAFRISKLPTEALTPRIGLDQIRALRDEARKRLGARFSAPEFHLRLVRQGAIPSGYFRDGLLRELDAQQ